MYTKYIEIECHFVHNKVMSGNITTKHVSSQTISCLITSFSVMHSQFAYSNLREEGGMSMSIRCWHIKHDHT